MALDKDLMRMGPLKGCCACQGADPHDSEVAGQQLVDMVSRQPAARGRISASAQALLLLPYPHGHGPLKQPG